MTIQLTKMILLMPRRQRFSSHLVRNNSNLRPQTLSSTSCLQLLWSSNSNIIEQKLCQRYYQYHRRHRKQNQLYYTTRWNTNATLGASSSSSTKNSDISTDDEEQSTTLSKSTHKNLRIAKELARHVWPSLPNKSSKTHANDNDDNERKYAMEMRQRVVASVSLMLAGKGVTIATPFMFKALIDTLPMYTQDSTIAAAATNMPTYVPETILDTISTSTLLGMPALPAILLLSYGTSRTLSSLFQESRNAIFANVAQSAIRSVGRSTFDHVHSLDLAYHLNKNTGALGRIIERGNRSISFVLNAMVFNTIPTIIEVGVVTGCMGYTLFSNGA